MKVIQSPKVIDYIHLLILGAIWGSAFIAIEIAIENLTALQVAMFRILLAGLFLVPFVLYKREKIPTNKKIWFYIFITALLNNAIPFSLISFAQQHINSGTAAIILACGPFTTLIIGHIFTKDEKMSFTKLFGVILGFSGVFILFSQDIIIQNDLSLMGKFSVFLASCCYVISGFLIRKLTTISPLVCSCCMFFSSAIMMSPFVFSMQIPDFNNIGNSLYAIIFLAIVPTALASLLRVNLIQRVGMQFVSLVSYLIPLFAIIWSVLFFSQVPKTSTWMAFLFIVLGLLISKIKFSFNVKSINTIIFMGFKYFKFV